MDYKGAINEQYTAKNVIIVSVINNSP